jgi:hypothetical protein
MAANVTRVCEPALAMVRWRLLPVPRLAHRDSRDRERHRRHHAGTGRRGGGEHHARHRLPITTGIVLFGVLDGGAYRIPSEAMLPTVERGDRVMTTKTSGAERGDIVVFKPPAGAVSKVCGV